MKQVMVMRHIVNLKSKENLPFNYKLIAENNFAVQNSISLIHCELLTQGSWLIIGKRYMQQAPLPYYNTNTECVWIHIQYAHRETKPCQIYSFSKSNSL